MISDDHYTSAGAGGKGKAGWQRRGNEEAMDAQIGDSETQNAIAFSAWRF